MSKRVFSLLLAASVGSVAALEADRAQPVDVSADRSETSQKAGTTMLSGNVKISQGSMSIAADRAEVFQPEGATVTRVVLTGTPAVLEQSLDGDGGRMKAQARTIDYVLANNLVTLREQVKVEQARGTMTGELIEYDVKSGQLRGGGGGSAGRIQMRIVPDAPKAKN
jgi:lipopolysaccharide export system protein LptA